MRRTLGLTLCGAILLSLAAFSPAARAQATSWKQIPIPRLPEFHPHEPTRIVLSNGMVIFLQEDHELPLISAFANVRSGSREVPADKVGMLEI